jgi:4-hydroxybenzoate polyprenyltransferase
VPRLAWRDLVVIHRLEFPLPVTYLCYATWGACFATGDAGRLADGPILLAFVANALLILAGLALNVAADVRTDELHRDKSYLAGAVRRVGRRRVYGLAAAEAVAGLGCAVAVSVATGRWTVTVAATALGMHLLYNVEPIRLKRRGFAGPAVFGMSVVGLPFLVAYCAARPDLEPRVLPILAGLTVLAIGRTAWWAVPDRVADTASGIATPPVRYGPARALALACLILLAGLVLLGWGLGWRYGLPWVAPGIAAHAAFLAAAIALAARTSDHALPSAVRMRRKGMTLVMVGEVTLTGLALVA